MTPATYADLDMLYDEPIGSSFSDLDLQIRGESPRRSMLTEELPDSSAPSAKVENLVSLLSRCFRRNG